MLETIALTTVSFIGILILLVFAHEFGHFITAKLARVKVEEFGIGFPPRIVSFKRGETTYSLNAIPLGGFTKMLGEEDPTLPGNQRPHNEKPRRCRLYHPAQPRLRSKHVAPEGRAQSAGSNPGTKMEAT